MNNKQIDLTLYVSAVALALAVFLPLTALPVYGNVSYNGIADIESYLVILCALSGPALLFAGKQKLAFLSPLGVWLVLLFPAIQSLSEAEDTSLLGRMGNQAASVAQEYAADLFMNIGNFSWGGYVLLISLLVFTCSSILRSLK